MNRHWKLCICAAALVLVHLVVLSAGFLAPYDPARQHRDFPFAPPMRLHFLDGQGKLHVRPFICQWVQGQDGQRYEENCSQTWPLRFVVHSQNGATSTQWHLFGVDSPGQIFLLGTDDYGRDQLSRLFHGGQISLFAGFFATVVALALALLLGSIAGYFGAWADEIIMRASEIFMALPWIYLLFAVRALLPLRVDARQAFFLVIFVIAVTGWARPSRLIRGIVLSAKEREYVEAARGFGASNFYILRRHILPETWSVVLTQAAILIPQYILAEITLSFLGLGVGEPTPSWGNMLASLQKFYVLESYWWMFASGFALIPVFLLYYWLADALQGRITNPESGGC